MLKSTILPATLAVSLFAAVAPAATQAAVPPRPMHPTAQPAPVVPKNDLAPAALAQLAGEAGISYDQAKTLTVSQLYFLKEQRDTDRPYVPKAPAPLDWPARA
jgi:hypothetical protein